MKKTVAILALSVFALAACRREVLPGTDTDRGVIEFMTRSLASKGLLYTDDFAASGSSVKVYDYLSGYTGQVSINGGTPAAWTDGDAYIDDEINWNGSSWVYGSGAVYPWTAYGVHTFFGFMAHDGNDGIAPSALFGSTPELNASGDLVIPETTLTSSSTQLDYLYSDVVTRDLGAGASAGAVELEMNHLFSALSVAVQNLSDKSVVINSLTIQNLKNRQAATVAYSSGGSVSYTNQASDGNFFQAASLNKTLATNQIYDFFGENYVAPSAARTGRLVWPQSGDHLHPVDVDDAPIVLGFTIDGVVGEARLLFPESAWESGNYYAFTLQILDKVVELDVRVLPWEKEESAINFAAETITVTSPFAVDASTCVLDKSAETATVSSGQTIKANFSITNPINGIWHVAMRGDTDFFTVSPSSGVIDPLEDGGRVSLSIIPYSGTVTSDKTISLNFSVTTVDGRELDADSEVRGSGYQFILPQND